MLVCAICKEIKHAFYHFKLKLREKGELAKCTSCCKKAKAKAPPAQAEMSPTTNGEQAICKVCPACKATKNVFDFDLKQHEQGELPQCKSCFEAANARSKAISSTDDDEASAWG